MSAVIDADETLRMRRLHVPTSSGLLCENPAAERNGRED